ncbi:MAG: PAS domain-containing sensor histidine kinase [Aggregatilineales bacterium]
MNGPPLIPPVQSQEQIADLLHRLAETESALQAFLSNQVDAVLDPTNATPILLREAQEALRFSEARYRRLLSRMAAIVFELAPDGTTRFVNDAVWEVTGYSFGELEGKNWWEILCPGAQNAQVKALNDSFRTGDVTHYELILITKQGVSITLELNSANRYGPDGELVGILGFGIDITERKRIEKELGNYRDHLEQEIVERQRLLASERAAHAEAERANHLQITFLAMISHELRTPLTSIKGFASTLLADDVVWDTESQREFVSIINEEADTLTELIEQLLDLSRLKSGQLRLHVSTTAITEILELAWAPLELLTTQHALTIDIPSDLPPVMADPQRIRQVLLNLVNNAVKFVPAATPIVISAVAQGAFVQVDVRDQGPGIPAQNRARVFEAYWQGEDIKSPTSKGAGLGLAICQGLIEAHGGKIWIADQPTPGTTMSFTLPVAASV